MERDAVTHRVAAESRRARAGDAIGAPQPPRRATCFAKPHSQESVDTTGSVSHARRTVTTFRRIAAGVLVLALCAGNVALCEGWQATPEARMACCTNGTSCPMHKSDSHEHSSRAGVSQAQADTCCAASAQRRDSSAPAATFAASGLIALVPVAVFTVPTDPFDRQERRALVPLPVSSTPRHLLFSVLLV